MEGTAATSEVNDFAVGITVKALLEIKSQSPGRNNFFFFNFTNYFYKDKLISRSVGGKFCGE